MLIDGRSHRSIWREPETGRVIIIDQTRLPHRFETRTLEDLESACEAIRTMRVRGAPLIGATAAYGLAMAVAVDPSDASLSSSADRLIATRPTAVNLRWAVQRVAGCVQRFLAERRPEPFWKRIGFATRMPKPRVDRRARARRLRSLADARGGEPLRLLTHCNGWLATVTGDRARADLQGARGRVPGHVWVDETRPGIRARASRPSNSERWGSRTR